MFARFAADEVVRLRDNEAAVLWEAALRIAETRPAAADRVAAAAGLITSLPANVVVALHRFRAVGTVHNALLLRGVCGDLSGLPETPATVTPQASTPVVEAAELLSLALALLLGEPFTFQSLRDSLLVRHVVPVPGEEDTQTGASSATTLQWHVEDSFSDDRCDYLGLLCLRGNPDAVTFLAPARRLDLAEDVIAVLREPRYVIAPDTTHQLAGAADRQLVPVLTGSAVDPEICFDAIYQSPADPADEQAAAALLALTAALDRAVIGHVLQPGDLLFADNRRIVHGRTDFRPRYDGRDRWLLRTMTCSSIRAHRRRGAGDTAARGRIV